MRALFLLLSLLFLIGSAALAKDLHEEFAKDHLDKARWCSCQLNEQLLDFPRKDDESEDHLARIIVDRTILGKKACDTPCAAPALEPMIVSEGDRLGPSFIIEPPAAMMLEGGVVKMKNPYCPVEDPEDEECIQRQELRVTKPYHQPFRKAVEYTIRFRMMPETGGNKRDPIRWVIAQWKQEPAKQVFNSDIHKDESLKAVAAGEKWQASPFLAQRFDGGVFHLTVQAGDCRCIVASADGNKYAWKNEGAPPDCRFTFPLSLEDRECKSSLILEFAGEKPRLASPTGFWTEMKYRIKGGQGSQGGTIEVWQDGKLIVNVTGPIGYGDVADKPPQQKFKFGHYRDVMNTTDMMDIDRVDVVAK